MDDLFVSFSLFFCLSIVVTAVDYCSAGSLESCSFHLAIWIRGGYFFVHWVLRVTCIFAVLRSKEVHVFLEWEHFRFSVDVDDVCVLSMACGATKSFILNSLELLQVRVTDDG